MGRRRTLINDFGANWTTGRVSAKKNARMANEHDNNLNHHSISSSILCYQFNHEYSHNSNSYTRTIVSYCIISYILFSVFFYSIHWFHISFFFLYFLSNFFRTSFIFFSVFSACIKYYIQWFVANAIAKKKKRKKCDVVSAMSSRSNQTSLRQARRKSMDWLDCISVHGSENLCVETQWNLEISMIVRDRSDNASANYITSCCF